MRDLMITMAKVSPEDMLFKMLLQDLDKYQQNKSKENKVKLTVTVQLLAIKLATENEKVEDIIKDMNRLDATQNLLNPDKN